MRTQPSKSGFTLVELAIVLVIIGLIIGGVLVGKDLIHAAENRSLITQYQGYVAAVHTFQLKYRGLPGDLRNATDFWGALDTDNTTCQPLSSDDLKTCNGNGDKVLGTVGFFNERFRFWQHLANAELIAGQYTGVTGSGGTYHNIMGVNCPISKIEGIGWSASYTAANLAQTAATFWEYFPQGFFLRIGTQGLTDLNSTAITTSDAFSIDSKIDDGKPAKGRIWTRTWQNCTTATSRTDYNNAIYNVGDEQTLCSLHFYMTK